MTRRLLRQLASLLGVLLLGLGACTPSQAPRNEHRESAPGIAGVAAANPYAVQAGLEVLRKGGSAIDAAVAIQAMLGLVEPQSSGLGGGAFLMYYDGSTRRITAFNGREMAPAGATPDMFLDAAGQPLDYFTAVTSGRSTGTPGAIAMLGLAHDKFGRLPWSSLFGAAERAAEQGFKVPGRLARFASSSIMQATLPDARRLFAGPDGQPARPGDTLRNPEYAAALRTVAARGPRAILEGDIATQIVARTHELPLPGTMTVTDLARYQPLSSEPLCRPYLAYVVCVPPPPSSGVALLELLGMLEHTDIATRGPDDPQAWFLFAEASRLMYADRDRYVADPAFVPVPVEGLLDPAYVARRATLIGDRAGPAPAAGRPAMLTRGEDATREAAGTSHFVVIDARGNAVSMTTTVESIFGSGRAVDGFMLNNQLTDFSYVPTVDGRPVANAVAPGKRPRSSMTPVIVLDSSGRLYAALGSPGGSAILVYVAKTLVGLIAWRMPLQAATDLPNLYAAGNAFYGEVDKFPPAVLEGLKDRGIEVQTGRGEESGLHGFVIQPGGLVEGAADPRREGIWRTLGN